MTWRDSRGSTLTEYPRPSLAVDVALLTVLPGPGRALVEQAAAPPRPRSPAPPAQLAVLVHQRTDSAGPRGWSLPGTFVHERERLAHAVLRALREKTGVTGEDPRQLAVFDDPDRDPRGWVVAVAHADLVPRERLAGQLREGCLLAPVLGDPVRAALPDGGDLVFDHPAIVERAVAWAREAHDRDPDPRGLVGEEFTLAELRRVHEAVAGSRLQKDTFRRRWEARLVATGRRRRGGVGKPAELFRRREG